MRGIASREASLPWVWWDRDEPEDGLLGFHTQGDLDRFSSNAPGPYRRRLSADGRTISQLATWADRMAEVKAALNGHSNNAGRS